MYNKKKNVIIYLKRLPPFHIPWPSCICRPTHIILLQSHGRATSRITSLKRSASFFRAKRLNQLIFVCNK